ncbi:MAG: hypothetical protein AAB410_01335 [Patescibacteria group bacterium]
MRKTNYDPAVHIYDDGPIDRVFASDKSFYSDVVIDLACEIAEIVYPNNEDSREQLETQLIDLNDVDRIKKYCYETKSYFSDAERLKYIKKRAFHEKFTNFHEFRPESQREKRRPN